MVSNEKKARVIESIKKLLALGVSESEIVNNLTDVGINSNEAKKLINEARNPSLNQDSDQQDKVPEKNLYDEASKDWAIDEQISGQLGIKEKQESEQRKKEEKINQEKKDREQTKQKREDISNNIELGLKVKESPPSRETIPAKNFDEQKPSAEKEGIKEQKKGIGGFFGKKNNKGPIAELQKELNLIPKNEKPLTESEKTNTENNKNTVETKEKLPEEKIAEKIAPKILNDELEELWKKGIVTSINSKLSEMKKLKEDIGEEIDDKVNYAIKKELQQFKVLLESQKELIISTNKESLEDKQKEITFIIDAKISELKKQGTELSEGMKRVEEAKKEQEQSLQQIKTVLDEAKRTKAQLLVEMNSELMKAKSDAQAFIDTAEKHLQELDQRTNKTLELEKNIAEGFVQEAEQKIEALALTKADDLIEKLEVKLNNLGAMEKKIDPEKIEEKINLLDEFKKQFLINMQENLTQINVAIKEINEKNEEADTMLQEKTLAIDAKLEELTKFEKKFTEKLDKLFKK